MPKRGSHKLIKAATIAHTVNIAARRLRRRTERNMDGVAGEDQLGFLRGKGIRNAIENEIWTLDEELYACCLDWQNKMDRNQPKGNQNLLTRKKIDQQIVHVKVGLDQGQVIIAKFGQRS
jgi:hypothetical protein